MVAGLSTFGWSADPKKRREMMPAVQGSSKCTRKLAWGYAFSEHWRIDK